ncbi:MAG: hypothetical protein Athens041674_346 [Parcubacteria group bacterium Athens0416_74]|nr:MAG: hypothetical protein Athens041674_346 [Parcubacteria group bacterium Athens0416_74]
MEEPILHSKRQVAVYIPYRRSANGAFEFFLQKRDMNAPTHAGIFSMFGGGIENQEDSKIALMREVQEELCYEPKNPIYLMKCERSVAVFHVFIEEVGNDFEGLVNVQEGEYGKFLTREAMCDVEVSAIAHLVVSDMSEWLVRQDR